MSDPAREDKDREQWNTNYLESTADELRELYPHALNESEILRQMAQDVTENRSDE